MGNHPYPVLMQSPIMAPPQLIPPFRTEHVFAARDVLVARAALVHEHQAKATATALEQRLSRVTMRSAECSDKGQTLLYLPAGRNLCHSSTAKRSMAGPQAWQVRQQFAAVTCPNLSARHDIASGDY